MTLGCDIKWWLLRRFKNLFSIWISQHIKKTVYLFKPVTQANKRSFVLCSTTWKSYANGTMGTLVEVGRPEWCDSRKIPHLSTCTAALSFIPPRLCKCVLFHFCVSLHKNSTTSWVRQMFYCRARQLLKWLASIWVPLLQLAAPAEPGQSISMRRIGLEWGRWRTGRVSLNRMWQQAALLLFPREDDTLQMGGSREFRSGGSDITDIADTQRQPSHFASTEMQIRKLAYCVAPAAKGC